MRFTAAVCVALTLVTGPAVADRLLAPRLYDEGLDLGGSYDGEMVEGHRSGYFRIHVPSRTVVQPKVGGRFDVFVTPNLVGYDQATARAADAARRYCDSGGGGVVAVIEAQARYSDANLESWRFSGRCR